ncbi:MAG: hypothetical protein Unbinned1524contig1003_16 [Prokaryotic dsDNA virus sp.]|nr:MAG: hypothetical protein Unbinned1524contig1003_16 [Prokaryotic dsDNA virus sp.]|tara:strand:- start:1854 stop:2024 length:171 start_codon:yes stop_codon:yes gene_type:complete
MGIMERVDSYQFIFFLNWLIETKDYNAKMIVDVVEKPFRFRKEWAEFMESEDNKEW